MAHNDTPTALRFVSSTTPRELTRLISTYPVKVEVKAVMQGSDNLWYCWFTLLDEHATLPNIEVRDA